MMTPCHTVRSFDQDLENLARNLSTMVSKVRLGYGRAIKALLTHNVLMAEELIKQDQALDQIQLEIEKLCFSMLALRQPVAIDLRSIVSAIKVSSHLEHIGDDISNICKRVRRMRSMPAPALQACMRSLADSGQKSLDQLEALINDHSIEGALNLHEYDDLIDDHYTTLYQDILYTMKKSKKSVPETMHVLFAAKNIERIGDNCADIARLVYYQSTGEKLN
ncbi:MAG: phosphate signaling complex protein PhoU [Alphaproteobacteria bacterium]|nr:phosphate signaling complex protein PhoU [Alphaproteobacteria bacterium]